MAFQPINFLNAPVAESPFKDLVKTISEGYRAGAMPAQMARDARKQDLANQLAEMKLKEEAPRFEMEKSRAGLANMLDQAKLRELKRKEQLRNTLQSLLSDPNRQNRQASPGLSSQFSGVPYRVGVAPTEMQPATSQTQAIQQALQKNKVVQQEGNPQLYRVDEIYKNHPELRDQLKDLGYSGKTEIKTDAGTGQAFVTNTLPSGLQTIEALQVGRQPEAIARAKKIGEAEADMYKTVEDQVQGSQGAIDNLSYIVDLVDNVPNVENVVGPVNSWASKYFSNPEDAALFGSIGTSSGNIMLDAAKNIKGAFTGRDQTLIRDVKPNATDTFGVFRGKAKTMLALAKLAQQRNSIIAKEMREGKPFDEAVKTAREKTDFTPIRKQLDDILKPKMPTFGSKAEFQEYIKNLSPSERERYRSQLAGAK